MRHLGVLFFCLTGLIGVLTARAAVNRIVLRVNERIATTFDYQKLRAERIVAIRRATDLTPEQRQEALAEVGESVMSQLFEELLVLSRADQLGVAPSASAVANAVQQTKASSGIRTEEEFRAALQSSNMTFEEFQEQMRKNLMIQEVMSREVQPRVKLEEEDLRRYYQSHQGDFSEPERVKLREVIVLESSGLDAARMAELAAGIRERVVGEGLEEAVEGTAEEGLTTKPIELGWVEAGDLDRELEEAVWGLGAGEVSSPILGRGGLHLIQLVERMEARLKPFSDVQQEIEGRLRRGRYQREVQAYTEELEAKSYIVANPPPEAAGFRRAAVPRTDPLGGLSLATAAPEEGFAPAAEGAGEPAPDRGDGEP